MSAPDVNDEAVLDMEYRLTIAHRLGCECAAYFASRRKVLFPIVLRMATERGAEVDEFFHAYSLRVHERHLSGLSLAVTA